MNSLILLISLTFISITTNASPCKGHFINPIKDVCWDCLFPLTIGSAKLVKGSYPDTQNPKSIICACGETGIPRVGISLGYWEPFALVDVTRKPFCMVNLGTELNLSQKGLGGIQNWEEKGAFYYVHWYKYPVIYWLNLIASLGCMHTEGFDIAFPSELDPTWNDSELAFITNPESVLFSNPIARFACSADATKTLFGTAIDSLFWCQGAQGSTYPLSGYVAQQTGPISAALLLAERLNFKLHRLSAIRDSIGEDGPKLCETYRSAMMPKSRYRYQLVNTVPESDRCHPYGQSVVPWEAGHINLKDGDNFGFLMWQKRNCCFL